MVSFLLQENIDELQHLADHLLHIGDKNGYVYACLLYTSDAADD